MVDGILYFTIPDHVFAINARTGEHIWQYDFEDQGGHLVGQRGVGIYRDWLYFVTVDFDTGETKFAETEAEFEKIRLEFVGWCRDHPGRCDS